MSHVVSELSIAVASHTFCGEPALRQELTAHFPRARFNPTGRMLVGAELLAFLADSPAAIVGLEPIDAALLAACPALQVLAKFGVGLDSLDLAACARRGIAVLSSPGVNAEAVAELTLGLMIAAARRIAIGTHHLKRGSWVKHGGVQVLGKKVGLVGLGHVGKRTAALLQAVGCQVMAHDVLELRDYCAARAIEWASLEALLAGSDFVSLHVPLTAATRAMIGRAQLAQMRSSAFLVNTARGGLVDEEALHQALASGVIAGAAFDVFAEEPAANPRLLALENFIGTAHIAGNSREAIAAVGRAAIANLVSYLSAPGGPAPAAR